MDKIKERERIGRELHEMRIKKGLTQTELAQRTDLYQNHLYRIEKGLYSVGFDILQKIADALDCDISVKERNQ
jgi:transcriptional regulator with XRE-family HTH domain